MTPFCSPPNVMAMSLASIKLILTILSQHQWLLKNIYKTIHLWKNNVTSIFQCLLLDHNCHLSLFFSGKWIQWRSNKWLPWGLQVLVSIIHVQHSILFIDRLYHICYIYRHIDLDPTGYSTVLSYKWLCFFCAKLSIGASVSSKRRFGY